MKDARLAFIGAGNIARAIVAGLIDSGYPIANLRAADPSREQLNLMTPGVKGSADNLVAAKDADVVIICVKPNLVDAVTQNLAPIAKDKLFLSVAAGVTIASIEENLGEVAVIRCMPNTPALVGLGITGLCCNDAVSADQRKIADAILGAVSATVWFENESDLDIVTAVSGSGPAYFFYVMEAMELAASRLGLTPEVARTLVLQTALGAATMASRSDDSPGTLRKNVTSPGGTTEAAIKHLTDCGLPADFDAAIEAAWRRSQELAGTKSS